MHTLTRIAFAAFIALSTCCGAILLTGCSGASSSAPASSAATAASDASAAPDQAGSSEATSDGADDEQDNCYGNDLPARKS